MGKILIIIGILIVLIGILLLFKIPIPFGSLPGDISFKSGNASFYFPIVSCIIISIILSLLFYLFSRR